MNVSYMLELMGTLGVGEGANVVPEDVYLQYLNLANLELYSKTAPFNDDILRETQIEPTIGDNFFELEETPHLISSILVQGQKNPLVHRSRQVFSLIQFEAQNTSTNPEVYKRDENLITFFPFVTTATYNMIVMWAPPPEILTTATEEADIPYPVCYHDTLVWEALCGLFAGEGGLRTSKNQERAEMKAKTRTSSLMSYLQGSNIHNINTFRNA